MNVYHTPALLNESIDGLNIHPDGVYVDVTFGGGDIRGNFEKIRRKRSFVRLIRMRMCAETV